MAFYPGEEPDRWPSKADYDYVNRHAIWLDKWETVITIFIIIIGLLLLGIAIAVKS